MCVMMMMTEVFVKLSLPLCLKVHCVIKILLTELLCWITLHNILFFFKQWTEFVNVLILSVVFKII